MAQPNPARTYVMAYWPIPGNAKRPLDHYTEHLALSLQMLAGQNLYFISGNNKVLSSVESLSQTHGIRLHLQKVLLDDLPKRPQMEALLQRARNFGAKFAAPPADFQRDKGLIHYWRDLRQSGEDTFKRVFCIWHSKIGLLHNAAVENPFGSLHFAWADASISRFNRQRAGWDFREIEAIPGVIRHYPNVMRKNGRELALNASFLLGDRAAIDALHAAYGKAFAASLGEDYPNDEETVLDSVVARQPQLFRAITGAAAAPTPAAGSRRKVLVVGAFRSGTNAMQSCLEAHFDVEVTFNEWFWKHGVPPTGIQCPVPPDVPVVVMAKSPYAFHESLYPFWLHRRPNLDSGPDVSAFARRELQVFDVSGGDLARPKYWFRCPTDYWNHFYFSWLSWTAVRPRCQFVRYEDVDRSTHDVIARIAERFGLRRKTSGPITLPAERVGPHVPTERKGERFLLTEEDRAWIRGMVHPLVARSLGYEL
ncbi:hypothetical protein [Aestuariivirga sp.]|uniref:hypothetical protein n=1 Tax=Aestuariivirga sp. TaxID=2650926 RepID=UPI0025C54086|nr:hypothetical protein [Aestuariivirga sp.]MCA3554400.1 hypothetical protein [Aestuariivirga sp.]